MPSGRPHAAPSIARGWWTAASARSGKPDRAKFVTYVQANGVNLQIAVDPGFPNAWRKEPYYGRIKQWAREGAPEGRFVYVRIGARLIALLPDREQDLGQVDPGDDIFVARKRDAAGFGYEIEVRKKPRTGSSSSP
jgi:hypothetical protein